LTIGSRYLAEQLLQFDGQVTLALAAYNAGPAAVRRSGNRVPPIRETQDYVRKVLRAQRDFKAAQALRDAPA
jgi:soluble lytic murein transglycosylase-like protein